MAELINTLMHYNFNERHLQNETEVGGIDAILWLGCGKRNDKIMQVSQVGIFD